MLCTKNIQWLRKPENIVSKGMRFDKIKFEQITIFNKSPLFTTSQISSDKIYKGLHNYECQHAKQNGIITMIDNTIRVNFLVPILTTI